MSTISARQGPNKPVRYERDCPSADADGLIRSCRPPPWLQAVGPAA